MSGGKCLPQSRRTKEWGQQQQKQGVLQGELEEEGAANTKEISLAQRDGVAPRPNLNRMLLLLLLIAAT
jgi:hypothetical protein